ncbi:ATP-binding protein [Nocardiopsis sp. NPDC057823]|uniref:ATP-binding protein n=1 Tax=Nocardiopsis sp. NPDC057823 TaxID=3346256 RepID=UPI00366E8264
MLTGSVLVAVCSITATAWLSVQRTSESINVQQGETLAVDTHIHDTLVGYAATHRGWEGVEETVRVLAGETGRRIVLTTEGRAVIADSALLAAEPPQGAAGDAPPLPPRTSSVVDALAVDVTLAAESGDRIDPRAVGPFALTDHERALLRADAEQGADCLRTLYGVAAEAVTGPTGRPVVETEQADAYMWDDCGLDALDRPVGGEEEALADLNALAADCAPDSGTDLVYAMDGRTGGLVITGPPPADPPEAADDARAPAAPEDPGNVSPSEDPGAAPPEEGAGEDSGAEEPLPGGEPSIVPDAPAPGEEVPWEVPQDPQSPWEPAPSHAPDPSGTGSLTGSRVEVPPEAAPCLDAARRAQLDPYVAPAALLFIDDPAEDAAAGPSLSREGVLRVGGVVVLVLVLTVVVSTTLATRLLRPVHALTDAVNRMREGGGPARVEVRDSGEIGRLAEAFNEMSEHLERAEEQRKAMVSDVSHELRTPLSNLRGWLEAVQDGVVDPEPDRMGMLLGETLLLQAVIDDLQDLALADAGRLRLDPEPVEAGPLVEQVVAGHGLRAEEAGVRLVSEVRDVTLVADRTRLLQVLGNLVGNALRHTPEGGTVTVQAHRAGSEAVLRVSDTGVGIAREDLPHVFDRFWRADKSRNRRTGGSGLGLAIVRGLVELHGGTVAVSSTVGEGTAFTLRLPLAGPPGRGPARGSS